MGLDTPGTSRALRGVVIGCGYASQFHLRAWERVANCSIVAVADEIPGRAAERASAFGIPMAFTNADEMILAERPDFIDIATRPDNHLELVSAGALAGADILCQKPAANSLTDLRTMMQACQDANVFFAVNENFRFQPHFRAISQLLRDGVLGRVHHATLSSRARLTLPARNFQDQSYFADMPRLLVLEFGLHLLDVARYLFGEPTSVYAHTHKASHLINGEDVATIVLGTQSGAIVLDLSWASAMPPSQSPSPGWLHLTIEGSAGTLELTPDWRLVVDTVERYESLAFSGDTQEGYNGLQEHFADCLRTGVPAETNGLDNLRTMELAFGAYHSAKHMCVYRTRDDLHLLD
jgi:D-apiose dehydrogenase